MRERDERGEFLLPNNRTERRIAASDAGDGSSTKELSVAALHA
jgi:hypothetical protein